mmetsp:Transcript_119051/g.167354  ORF Transcript_119051/g.167354 Transcript_119051/m.167354 type:complete len:227 (+) Transcript_119051:20-700(+)
MMRPVLFLVLCVAYVTAERVCLNDVFQWKRSTDFFVIKGDKPGFDESEEYFDRPGRQYRYREIVREAGGKSVFNDVIIKAKERKMWTITGKQGGGSVNCTVATSRMPDPYPCTLSNATRRGSVTVAGNIVTNVFFEDRSFRKGAMEYEELLITADVAAPVARRAFFENAGEVSEFYFDYSTTLPPDAFVVPGICPQSEPTEVVDEEEMKRRYPGVAHMFGLYGMNS